MNYVYLTLNWVFGVMFGLIGLTTIFESLLGGICLIVISMLLLPPVNNFVHSKTKMELTFKAKAASIFVLVIAFGIFSGQSQEKKTTELAAQKAEEQSQKASEARQHKIDYFNSHREEIIASASSALSEKDYKSAMNKAVKYLPANDAELNEIYNQAKKSFDEIAKTEREAKEKLQREAQTKELVAKLKTVPASKLNRNKVLYQQLVKLNPLEAEYKQKLDHYSRKLSENLEKEKTEKEIRIAKFGEAPSQSGWDGSYYAVERHLKRVANDPDSIDIDSCTKVYYTESGWLVGCDYRGRNGFGGMIRQSNWFTIVHNQVIEMKDASAHRP